MQQSSLAPVVTGSRIHHLEQALHGDGVEVIFGSFLLPIHNPLTRKISRFSKRSTGRLGPVAVEDNLSGWDAGAGQTWDQGWGQVECG